VNNNEEHEMYLDLEEIDKINEEKIRKDERERISRKSEVVLRIAMHEVLFSDTFEHTHPCYSGHEMIDAIILKLNSGGEISESGAADKLASHGVRLPLSDLETPKPELSEKLDDLRVRFFRLYPNLPLGVRALPCIVIKIGDRSEPLSWRVCYAEIGHNTHLSRKILFWLGEMEFI
jgi:hypothetical protein